MLRLRPLALAALMLAIPLSGCLADAPGPPTGTPAKDPSDGAAADPAEPTGTPASAACTRLEITPPRAGAEFVYNASGIPFFPPTLPGAIIDWEVIGDNDTEGPGRNEALDLPKGSTLRVALGDRTRDVLDLYGTWRPAYQVTYWADHPDHSRPVAVQDEWGDLRSGRLLDLLARASKYSDGDVEQKHFMGRLNHPPVMTASLFWNRTLTDPNQKQDSTTSNETALEAFFPGTVDRDDYQHRVLDIRRSADGCVAEVQIQTDRHRARMTFVEGIGLPVTYKVRNPQDDVTIFTLDLRDMNPGDGFELPEFAPAEDPDVGSAALERAPPQEDFLPGRGDVFTTSFDKAVEEIRDQDDYAREWLKDHPDAVPVAAKHRLGHPDGLIEDVWSITWLDPNGSKMGATVQYKWKTALEQERTYETGRLDDYTDYTFPDLPDRWVKLSEMSRIHREVYGKDPEVMWCDFSREECKIGAHRSMHKSYRCGLWCQRMQADPVYNGSSTSGFRFDIGQGFVYAEKTFDPSPIPPPAG